LYFSLFYHYFTT